MKMLRNSNSNRALFVFLILCVFVRDASGKDDTVRTPFDREERLREIQERLDKRGIKVPDHVGYKKDRAGVNVDDLEIENEPFIDLSDEEAVEHYKRSRSKLPIEIQDRMDGLEDRGIGAGPKLDMENLHRQIADRHVEREERAHERLVEKARKAGFEDKEFKHIEKDLLRIKKAQIEAHEERVQAFPSVDDDSARDSYHRTLTTIADKTRQLSDERREIEIRIREKEKENRGYKRRKEKREL